ncbi:T9SS type A sorting domain-containing protein [Flavobacterium sp. J49]|uniref:T9SS type A sorting domain-containing protein n=1 Tax=Flavobacterium sp. J49 TaxID=2718534 RepID=UPI001593E30A|nr:T9SS type A sorting domain-containing protein [Flavobacterium sp. J49]MBF6642445.1 T9SS type A sorting domain-containing protein [Flavobacterium sp. J49]NIC03691.1 T9SS type A sorting domain-containing protein [Flavobacterium sp. J49]
MKQHYLLLSIVLLLSSTINAQVVNGNFETVKPNLLPSNWGMNFTQPVSIDTQSGGMVTNQIQYTTNIPSMVYAVTDSQNGQFAMEISNAFNTTQNQVIPGSATIFSDANQDFPGWNAGIPIAVNAQVYMIGFYYKFLPVGNDIAEAKIEVFDNNGALIGNAEVDIMGTNNQFEYVYMPINFTSNAVKDFMTISFSMAKEGSTPTFGSRLLVDNVVTNFEALDLLDTPISAEFLMYPTLADHELNIIPGHLQSDLIDYKIIDTQGKIIKQNTTVHDTNYIYTMDVSQLNSGMYFLQATSNTGSITKKFIKK